MTLLASNPRVRPPIDIPWTPAEHGTAVDFWSTAENDRVIFAPFPAEDEVTTWLDQSGNENDATHSLNSGPWSTTGWHDGSPALRVESSENYIINNLSGTSGNDYLIAVAVDLSSVGANQCIYSLSVNIGLAYLEVSGAYGIREGGPSFAFKTTGTTTADTQSVVWALDSAVPTGTIYKNGTALAGFSPSDYSGSLDGGQTCRLGARPADPTTGWIKAFYVTRDTSIIRDPNEVQKVIDWVESFR